MCVALLTFMFANVKVAVHAADSITLENLENISEVMKALDLDS